MFTMCILVSTLTAKQSPGLKDYTPPLLKFLDPPLDRERTESYRSTAISLADFAALGYIRPRPIRSSSSFSRTEILGLL